MEQLFFTHNPDVMFREVPVEHQIQVPFVQSKQFAEQDPLQVPFTKID